MTAHETLGVGQDATEDEIKKAYRNKAKTMHPDVGGDREQFERIQAAYDELTGDDSPPSQAANIVINLYNELLLKHGENTTYINLEAEIAAKISQTIEAIRTQITQTKETIRILERINKNCTKESIVKRFNESRILDGTRQIKAMGYAIRDHETAIEIANALGYMPDEDPRPVRSFTTTGYTFTFTGGQ